MTIPFPRTAAALLAAATVVACTAGVASATESTCPEGGNECTWNSPGTYEWTVPEGVHELHVTLAGGQGAGDLGGGGGHTEANLAVQPGEKLQLSVGGRGRWGGNGLSGGFNGGGEAADWIGAHGGGGGGGTDIYVPKTTGSYPLIIVGGGGGETNGLAGGNGGGAGKNGGDGKAKGLEYSDERVATGATPNAPGIGAIAYRYGTKCHANDGIGGKGADGESCRGTGGGGGGGRYGGGGGTRGASGAGGSGYLSNEAAVIERVFLLDSWKEKTHGNGGNGQITISW